MGGWQYCYSKIDRVPSHSHEHAAVLGRAAFCNVKRCHDLEARHDSALYVLRDGRHLAHDSVDAGADDDPAFFGLEMDVRRAFLDTVRECGVDVFDRRRARSRVQDLLAVLGALWSFAAPFFKIEAVPVDAT